MQQDSSINTNWETLP